MFIRLHLITVLESIGIYIFCLFLFLFFIDNTWNSTKAWRTQNRAFGTEGETTWTSKFISAKNSVNNIMRIKYVFLEFTESNYLCLSTNTMLTARRSAQQMLTDALRFSYSLTSVSWKLPKLISSAPLMWFDRYLVLNIMWENIFAVSPTLIILVYFSELAWL